MDYVALSFVRSAADVLTARRFLDERGAAIPLIAKIEKHEALASIDAILAAADGLMVARGDLGVETPLEHVPLLQKMLIERANRAGKPVITATQMLLSMVENPRPTRAEVGDVANAILDGTDAVMLSEETAAGRYPAEAVATMRRIAEDAETAFPFEAWMRRFEDKSLQSLPEAVAGAACELAEHIGASVIVAWTESGATARLVAKHRPRRTILALSTRPETARRLALVWGVIPLLAEKLDEHGRDARARAPDRGGARPPGSGRDRGHHRRHPDGRRGKHESHQGGDRPRMTHARSRTPIHARRMRNILLGIFFFILGVIGILIPVMPQIVFFFLSALFFSMVSPRLRRALRRFRKRHPSVDRAYAKWRSKAPATSARSSSARRGSSAHEHRGDVRRGPPVGSESASEERGSFARSDAGGLLSPFAGATPSECRKSSREDRVRPEAAGVVAAQERRPSRAHGAAAPRPALLLVRQHLPTVLFGAVEPRRDDCDLR